jgi:hypothetical protein
MISPVSISTFYACLNSFQSYFVRIYFFTKIQGITLGISDKFEGFPQVAFIEYAHFYEILSDSINFNFSHFKPRTFFRFVYTTLKTCFICVL